MDLLGLYYNNCPLEETISTFSGLKYFAASNERCCQDIGGIHLNRILNCAGSSVPWNTVDLLG